MKKTFVHKLALCESQTIGEGTFVWAFAHIMEGSRIGSNCVIGDHSFVETGAEIGNDVTVKNGVMIWDGINIKDGAFIGPGVIFTNDLYPRSPRFTKIPGISTRYSEKKNWLLPTIVSEGATLGARAVVGPGVNIGKYAMIGAGALVTSDVPAFSLVTGTPGKIVGAVCRCGLKLEDTNGGVVSCNSCGEIIMDLAGKLEEQ